MPALARFTFILFHLSSAVLFSGDIQLDSILL